MKLKIVVIAAIALIFASCGTTKKNVNKQEKNNKVVKKEVTPEKDVVDFVETVKNNYLKYDHLQVKFSAKYSTSDKTTQLKGLMKIQKDKFIWISVRPGLGIELARVLLTPDSVKFINRIQSQYFLGDYKYFEEQLKIKIDYYTIQSILTDEFFVYPKTKGTANELLGFQLIKEAAKSTLKKVNKKDSSYQNIVFSNHDYKVNQMMSFSAQDNRSVFVNYTDFRKLNNTEYPHTVTAKFIEKGKPLNFNIVFSKFVFGNEFHPKFKISERYKRIEIKK